jgi:3-oxoacyl-[acyl-carrier-protein] synthase III
MRTVPITVDSLGNIVSANIPVALNLLERRGHTQYGDKIILSENDSGICLNQAGLIWDGACAPVLGPTTNYVVGING